MQPECLPHQLHVENYAENFPAVLNVSHQEFCAVDINDTKISQFPSLKRVHSNPRGSV